MVARERADAARNRRAILDAASALFEAATDPLAVTMDDIAASAGVGKGTLFRRFGDRAGLVRAVYATRFGALYEAITSGPPPLGPGVPAHERALAVLDAIVSVKLDNRRIALVLESLGPEAESTSLFDSANYRTAHTLLAELAAELVGADRADWTAHVLLSATRIDLVEHLVDQRGWSGERVRGHLRELAERLLGPA